MKTFQRTVEDRKDGFAIVWFPLLCGVLVALQHASDDDLGVSENRGP